MRSTGWHQRLIKLTLFVFGPILLTIGGCLTILWTGTAAPAKIVDAYLVAASRGDVSAAQNLCVPGFAFPDAVNWPEFWRMTGHSNAKSIRLTSRTLSTAGARLGGMISLTGGGELAAEFQLEKVSGTWRIRALFSGYAGAAQPLPTIDEAARLLRDDFSLLAQAVESSDFSSLYARCSTLMRKKYPMRVLAAAFQFPPEEATIDWKASTHLAQSARPSVQRDESGIVVAAVTLETSPKPVNVRFSYAYEVDQWYLHNIFVSDD